MSAARKRVERYAQGKELLQLIDAAALQKGLHAQIVDVVARLIQHITGSPGALKENNPDAQPSDQSHGEALAVIEGVQLLTPRGKFDLAFFSDRLVLRGAKQAVIVPFAAVQHAVILESVPQAPKDKQLLMLVLDRSAAVMHGKTQLEVVVLQTQEKPTVTLPTPAACPHLGDQLSGPVLVVVCALLGGLLPQVDEAFFMATGGFSTAKGELAVSAHVKAQQGWLYPLEGAFAYVGKPSRFLPHAQLRGVELARTGGSSATFDLVIKTEHQGPLSLDQIDQQELALVKAYVASHRLQAAGSSGADGQAGGAAGSAGPSSKRSRGGDGSASAGAALGGDDVRGAARGAEGEEPFDSDEDDSDFDPNADQGEAAEPPRAKKAKAAAGAAAEDAAASEDIGSQDDEDEDEGDEDEYETDAEAGGSDGNGSGDGSSSEGPSLVDEEDLDGLSQE